MDFSIDQKHQDILDRTAIFAKDTLQNDASKNDKSQEFPNHSWQQCADFGIQKLALPAAYGGPHEEVDFLAAIYAMEGFGYGCKDNGLAFGLNAQMWTVQTPILHFGSDEQKEKYLNPLGSGDMIGAHALTEKETGSDVYSMQLAATKEEEFYILNGDKYLITLAPVADVFLVFAVTNAKLGKWGISAFLIDRGTEGLLIPDKYTKMGMRSIPIGSLEFNNVKVPKSALLGKEGLGFSILNHSLEYDRCCILASQLGALQRQLEENIKYVRSRKQFKQEIGKFQSVSNRIADMKLRLETSRLLLYKTAWLKSTNQNALLESALIKLHLSESFVASSMDSIRNGGGQAYLSDNEVERDLRDAVGGVLYAGTSDIQRNIITKLLGL